MFRKREEFTISLRKRNKQDKLTKKRAKYSTKSKGDYYNGGEE